MVMRGRYLQLYHYLARSETWTGNPATFARQHQGGWEARPELPAPDAEDQSAECTRSHVACQIASDFVYFILMLLCLVHAI